jgi:hypothetical protein
MQQITCHEPLRDRSPDADYRRAGRKWLKRLLTGAAGPASGEVLRVNFHPVAEKLGQGVRPPVTNPRRTGEKTVTKVSK